eukprot:5907923-Pyramimonas_sp.AAC.1
MNGPRKGDSKSAGPYSRTTCAPSQRTATSSSWTLTTPSAQETTVLERRESNASRGSTTSTSRAQLCRTSRTFDRRAARHDCCRRCPTLLPGTPRFSEWRPAQDWMPSRPRRDYAKMVKALKNETLATAFREKVEQ